jgi:hypothetical protein
MDNWSCEAVAIDMLKKSDLSVFARVRNKQIILAQ